MATYVSIGALCVWFTPVASFARLPSGRSQLTNFDYRQHASSTKGEDPLIVWGDTWYPLAFTKFTDPSRPHKATVLGTDVAFWRSEEARGEWYASIDECPHRLAPLSEGRVVGKGIECPYHGWKFEGKDGRCTSIPQLPGVGSSDSQSIQQRARISALPVVERQGIIWCYARGLYDLPGTSSVDENDQNAAAIRAAKLSTLLVPELEPDRSDYIAQNDYSRDLPMDAMTLLENVLDPSHLPFTHHNTISSRMAARALILTPCDLYDVGSFSLPKASGSSKISNRGFAFSRGVAETLSADAPANSEVLETNCSQSGIEFKAPHHVISVTRRPGR